MTDRELLLGGLRRARQWLCLLGLVCWATACGPKQETATVSAAPLTPPTNVSATAHSDKGSARYESLKGKWLRSDGDYLLEISSIDTEGKMAAAYYNPRPINISQARTFYSENKLRAIIELRDTGYPGCIYNLAYESGRDELVGTYFQAAMNETYEIRFTRLKE